MATSLCILPRSTASPPEKATYRGGFFVFLAILRPLGQHKFVSLSILSSPSRPTHLLFATGSERSLSLLDLHTLTWCNISDAYSPFPPFSTHKNDLLMSCKTNIGLLLLRLSTGGLMLFHGVAKLQGGLGFLQGMLAAKGLPAFLAYGALVGEILAPLAIIFGLFTRGAAAVVAFNMLVAITMVHLGDLCAVNPQTGGWAVELPMLYLLSSLALVFTGGGRFAVSNKTWLD